MAGNVKQNLSKEVNDNIVQYMKAGQNLLVNQFSLRDEMETVDRQYMREENYTTEQLRARYANRLGNSNKIQDVTVPVVMPQVQSALGYLTNVFLTGYPIFGVGADPMNEDAALQMETIIAENAETAGWARQLLMFFRDGLKYNLHAIECSWDQRTTYSVENDILSPASAKTKKVLWQGNCLKRMDLYNTFFDPRVHPADIHTDGEFAGYLEIMSRTRFKKLVNSLFETVSATTAEAALNSTTVDAGISNSKAPYSYYIPTINPFPLMRRENLQTFDWMAWANNNAGRKSAINYSNIYVVAKLYARIIPDDFGMNVPERNTPQIWKFIIVNGTVVLLAERQTNVHDMLPIIFGQPLEDGLDFQTKSFAQNVADSQYVASALWNGYLSSKRRLVGDRVLYDPSRINKSDISSVNPVAKIPVRPSAYGTPLSEAVYQFPFRDEQTQSMLDGADRVVRFSNLVNGQNPAQQGQFVKGNKTLHEYEDVMGHGNNQNQMMAIMTENQVLVPLKQQIKLNILQYQQQTTLYNHDAQQQVKVDPITLRKQAVQFKVSDGLLPEDKELNTDEFTASMQVLSSAPQIGAGYNLAPLFTYIMKLRGADLQPFEKSPEQVQYEQALQVWQQAAAQAAQKGIPFNTPMPKPPATVQQQQQEQQQNGGTNPDPKTAALQSTQGA